jgi:hypothetical protein
LLALLIRKDGVESVGGRMLVSGRESEVELVTLPKRSILVQSHIAKN